MGTSTSILSAGHMKSPVAADPVSAVEHTPTRFLWLDLTRKCQLRCTHCYNASGPHGTHGAMTRDDWISVLDQAVRFGVRRVQFIGGEPSMHPEFPALLGHALDIGLGAETYSNLVHVPSRCWELFRRPGASLATSYYSVQAEQHNAVTGRRSHERTRMHIEKAVRFGIPLRVGIVSMAGVRDVGAERRELTALGVKRIGVDHVRPFGRGAEGRAPSPSGLCGRCGDGVAAVGPDGGVSPCVFTTGWLNVGNVQRSPLAAILSSPALAKGVGVIRSSTRSAGACDPACDPNAECSPGFPSGECDPRR